MTSFGHYYFFICNDCISIFFYLQRLHFKIDALYTVCEKNNTVHHKTNKVIKQGKQTTNTPPLIPGLSNMLDTDVDSRHLNQRILRSAASSLSYPQPHQSRRCNINININRNSNNSSNKKQSKKNPRKQLPLKKVKTFDEVILCRKVLSVDQYKKSDLIFVDINNRKRKTHIVLPNHDKNKNKNDKTCASANIHSGTSTSSWFKQRVSGIFATKNQSNPLNNLIQSQQTQMDHFKCSICLDSYQVGDEIGWSRNPNCHHLFHKKCIIEWLQRQEHCPLCRHPFYKKTACIKRRQSDSTQSTSMSQNSIES